MLVTDDPGLIRNGHLDDRILVQDDTLATQAGFQPRIDSSVNEILFLVGDLLEKFLSGLDIDMAGTAGTDTTTIMVQMNIVILCNLQNRIALFSVLYFNRSNGRVFKFK